MHTTPISAKKSLYNGFKIKQTKHLDADVSSLKEFIREQLYVIKRYVEGIRSETVISNNLELIESLKKEEGILGTKV